MTASSKNVVLGFFHALVDGDLERAADAFAENATMWVVGSLPFSGTLQGRNDIVEKNLKPSMALSVPGSLRVEMGAIIEAGSEVAVEWVFKRKTATGRDYANNFCGLFKVRDGRIESFREYLDTEYARRLLWPD